MARILTLDAALATCSAGLVEDGRVLFEATDALSRAASLPDLVRAALAAGALPDLVAVTVGPGSFTGLRAAIALAHGIAIGAGIPVTGVTTGAAMAHLAPPGRTLWTATDNKRGRLFLERGGEVATFAADELPLPPGPIALAGDAAREAAEHLAARGADAIWLDAPAATPLGIALAAARPGRPALPLYVDPPQATPGPAGRPPPA